MNLRKRDIAMIMIGYQTFSDTMDILLNAPHYNLSVIVLGGLGTLLGIYICGLVYDNISVSIGVRRLK